MYYQITKKFVFNQPLFDKGITTFPFVISFPFSNVNFLAYEINQSDLIYTKLEPKGKNIDFLKELLAIENVQVEPNLWEENII